MIKAVLYDMDGTVLDTMVIYERSWAMADKDYGLGGRAAALVPMLGGMNRRDCETFTCDRLGADFPYAEFRKRLEEHFARIVETEGIPCKPGAPEIFDRIRKMGIRQVLVTSSSPQHVFPFLKVAGIENEFDDVVTGDRVVHGKPNPEIFLLGAEAAGCEPCECVVVEDSVHGARAGIAGGMKTIMIPEYPPIPEDIRAKLWHECKTLAEIPDLIAAER